MTANREDEDAMNLPALEDSGVLVTLGVDTHLDEHVAVALDQLGRRLDELSVPTTEVGYAKLLRWAESLGKLERVGIEVLEVEVLEVGRPKRKD